MPYHPKAPNIQSPRKPAFCLSSLIVFYSVCLSYRFTAKVVQTLCLLKDVIKVDYTSVAESVDWLIRDAQNGDGSFRELAMDSKRVVCGSLFTSPWTFTSPWMMRNTPWTLDPPRGRVQVEGRGRALSSLWPRYHG